MARPFTALRRFAVVSAAGVLAGVTALVATQTAAAATAARTTAASIVAAPRTSAACPVCPTGAYVVLMRHEGLLSGLFDGLF